MTENFLTTLINKIMTKDNISNQNGAFDINSANFSAEVLNSDKPVLIDFYANWCKPCQNFLPIVNEVADQLAETLKTVKINIDDNPEIAQELGVRSIPALFLFKDGQQIANSPGSRSKVQLLDWVKNSIN
jgi:thioredoxin 1